jgi:two-component system, response regulator PdtaR
VRPKRSGLKASAAAPHPSAASFRPRIVFAREDGTAAGRHTSVPPRIAIVEDDFLIAWQAETALSEAGFTVVGVVGSAEEALRLVEEQHPSLVLMDIRLAGERDGIDAAIELFERHGTRCVFATAHHDAAARARAERAKPLAWLPKPYAMASVVAVMHEAVKRLRDG